LEAFESEGWPTIRGVLHTAGVLDDHSLLELDIEALKKVLLPKISGGWLLHRLLGDVETFILFSSLNSIIAQPGQSNYAAANAFLDALAHYRRQEKQTALSINWGIWADVGLMSTETGKRNSLRMAEKGIESFTPNQGLQLLEMVMERESTQAVAAQINWNKLRNARAHPQGWALISLIQDPAADHTDSISKQEQQQKRDSFYASITSAAEQRETMLREYLQSLTARILRLAPHRIAFDKPFREFGLDSLMSIELRNQLESDLRLKLSATLIWNYPTIDRLASYLDERLTVPSENQDVTTKASLEKDDTPMEGEVGKLVSDVDGLSDDEVLQFLLKGE
jgi:acyl carrier protein